MRYSNHNGSRRILNIKSFYSVYLISPGRHFELSLNYTALTWKHRLFFSRHECLKGFLRFLFASWDNYFAVTFSTLIMTTPPLCFSFSILTILYHTFLFRLNIYPIIIHSNPIPKGVGRGIPLLELPLFTSVIFFREDNVKHTAAK